MEQQEQNKKKCKKMFSRLLSRIKLSDLIHYLNLTPKPKSNWKYEIKETIALLVAVRGALSKLKPQAPSLTLDYFLSEDKLFKSAQKLWFMKN